MAAALLRLSNDTDFIVESAGIEEGDQDPFVEAVMEEMGETLNHVPKSLDQLLLDDYDEIIALTPHAAMTVRERAPNAMIEFWDIENPSNVVGSRTAIIESYRGCRKVLAIKIASRFASNEH